MDEGTFARRTKASFDSHRKRAAQARQPITYTLQELRHAVRNILEYAPICLYCSRTITEKTFSLDHRQPLCREGPHELQNLAIVCQVCNCAKGPLTETEYRDLQRLVASWPPKASTNVLARLRAAARIIGY